jgi:hypothetical protein
MTQHNYITLIFWQRLEGLLKAPAAVAAGVVGRVVGLEHLLARHWAPLAKVVDCDVASDAQDPRSEWHLPRLVLVNDADELHEDVLCHILGLVLVPQDAEHISVNVVLVPEVQKANRLHVSCLRSTHRAHDLRIAIVLFQRGARAEAVS